MSFVFLGRSGLRVSRICLGTMIFGHPETGCDEAEACRILDAYYDAGHNFVDTADTYARGKSEEIVGRWLKKCRRDIVLATKVFWYVGLEHGPNRCGLSRRHIIEACEDSLRRLQTDYIDLYYVHIWDPLTPLAETVAALQTLVEQGKVRYLGLSDFAGWQVSEAMAVCRELGAPPFICHQVEYSVLVRDIEVEIAPASRYHGLGLVAWSPLAGGMLTGKYGDGTVPVAGSRFHSGRAGDWWRGRFGTPENFRAAQEFARIAKSMGVSPVSLAIAYSLLPEGMVSTIIGPRRLEHLKDNLAGETLVIPPEVRAELDALRPPPVLFPYPMQKEIVALRTQQDFRPKQ